MQQFTVEDAAAEEELARAFDQKVSAEDKERAAAEARAMQPLIDYYAALRRKYERAAARPWLPVEPDPPPPQVDGAGARPGDRGARVFVGWMKPSEVSLGLNWHPSCG
jgi:hypothetical protein